MAMAVTATWQAILRARHPEYSGLVVEVVSRRSEEPAGAA
jgi:hypothetical protein